MLRLILSGCHGRMGRQVTDYCSGRSDVSIAAGLDRTGRPADGFPVFFDPRLCHITADAMVDFSRPDALELLLPFCVRRRMPVVLAATGYSQRQLDQISLAAHIIPVFRASNLSIGANVLLKLARQAAAELGAEYDAAIIERHHKNKIDSPSGTALLLAQELSREAKVLSVRAGTTAGEHTVLLAGQNEVLELTHRADSREVYAAGAIRAARFLTELDRPGLYGMEDLLK